MLRDFLSTVSEFYYIRGLHYCDFLELYIVSLSVLEKGGLCNNKRHHQLIVLLLKGTLLVIYYCHCSDPPPPNILFSLIVIVVKTYNFVS